MITIEKSIHEFIQDYQIVLGRNQISPDFKKCLRPSPDRWNRTDFLHSNYYLIVTNIRHSLEIYINTEDETVEISLKDITSQKEEYVKHTLEWLWEQPYNKLSNVIDDMGIKLHCPHNATQPILGWENSEIGDYCLECGTSNMIYGKDKPTLKIPDVV